MVLAVLLSIGPACYSRKVQKVATVDVPQPKNERIVGVTTLKGEDVSFDPPGASIKSGTLSASVRKNNGFGWRQKNFKRREPSAWPRQ